MNKTTVTKRGRPAKNTEDAVRSNGLFTSQWQKILDEAALKGTGYTATQLLRDIVDEHYQCIAEEFAANKFNVKATTIQREEWMKKNQTKSK